MPCSGNSNEICGGNSANSVYLTSDSCRKHFNKSNTVKWGFLIPKI